MGVSRLLCSALLVSWLVPAAASAQGTPPTPSSPSVSSHAEVTFTGYEALPGGRGKIFVELSEAVAVEMSHTGQIYEYRLVGARVPLRNNKNPLLLQDFNVSALKAQLVTEKATRGKHAAKQRGKQQGAVRLVVTMRGTAAPTFKVVSRGKGAALEVELPPLGQ